MLLFDEPFSALDPLIRRDMQEEVIRLHREEGRTMVFITHDLSEALRLGDRIALMRDGRDRPAAAPRRRSSARPADDYVRDFVRDVPREQVMTVRRPCVPPDGGEARHRPGARSRRHVSEAIEAVARSGGHARVMDGGALPRHRRPQQLLEVVAGLDEEDGVAA